MKVPKPGIQTISHLDKSARYNLAVDWVDTALSPAARAGFLGPGNPPWIVTASELMVRYRIDFWSFGDDGVPSPMTERQAALLWSLAETERGAFDIARHASANYIHHGWRLPEGLRIFSTLYLGGQLTEPPIETLDKPFLRNFLILVYSTLASSGFGLSRTRSDDQKVKGESGCDAVVEALARNGVHIGYRAAKDLIVGNKLSQKEARARTQEVIEKAVAFHARNSLLFHGPDGIFEASPLHPRRIILPGGTSGNQAT